jgi:small neutral amino acid transporter SnatA (MarC family)
MAASASIGVVVFIFGALLLLIALIGGGFILKELSVPQVSRNARVACGITGVLFIGFSLWSGSQQPEGRKDDGASSVTSQPPTTPTEPFPTDRERDLLTQ